MTTAQSLRQLYVCRSAEHGLCRATVATTIQFPGRNANKSTVQSAISQGGLLAEHISRNRLMLSPIENENGKLVNVSVINPTIADQKDIVLLVRNLQNQKAYLVDEYGKQIPLALEPFENGYKVRINDLRAWSIKTVFFE